MIVKFFELKRKELKCKNFLLYGNNKGLIEERGFPTDIYTNPQSSYTQKLIKAIPKGTIKAIKAEQLKRDGNIAFRSNFQ